MAKPKDFDTNVFVNCPFDASYRPLLLAMAYTIRACGFVPRVALEGTDAATVRVDKIRGLIRSSRLAIHDISRTDTDVDSGLPRFNMPFELGLDIGARYYGESFLRSKKFLIFDREQYRFQKFLSDIAGQDISAHQDSADIMTEKVRDWLNDHKPGREPLLGAGWIRSSFDKFLVWLPSMCEKNRLDHSKLAFKDYMFYVDEWVKLTV